jgi:uncharacterized OB-fold protein
MLHFREGRAKTCGHFVKEGKKYCPYCKRKRDEAASQAYHKLRGARA